MRHVSVSVEGGGGSCSLPRKVNAIDEPTIDELKDCFRELGADEGARAVVFFRGGEVLLFGFDIPGFLGHSKPEFSRFLTKFTDLYTYLFTYPKPVVAALNGHTVAGGLMLALACDRRFMAAGKGKGGAERFAFGSLGVRRERRDAALRRREPERGGDPFAHRRHGSSGGRASASPGVGGGMVEACVGDKTVMSFGEARA